MKLVNYILIIILFINIFSSCSLDRKRHPLAENGVLDLRNWDFETDGNVQLDGDWEFYWSEFLKSKDFDTVKNKHYHNIPDVWRNYNWNGQSLPGMGYASYKLKILLKNKDQISFKIKDCSPSYQLYIQDSLVCQNGKVGTSKESSTPQYLPLSVNYYNNKDTLELVLWSSNFYYWKGGLWNSIIIGTPKEIDYLSFVNLLRDSILIGGLLSLVFYFICLAYFRRKEYIAIFFGLFCLEGVFRIFVTGEILILQIFPDISWELLVKLEIFSFFGFGPCWALYFYNLLKKDMSILITKIIIIITIILVIPVIFTDASIFSYLILPAQILAICIVLYTFFINIKSIIFKREGAIILFSGYFLFAIAIINEFLHTSYIVNTFQSIPIGIVCLFITQTVLLSRKFSKEFDKIETFSSKLELTVKERSDELENTNNKLSASNSTKDKFFSIIAHDLRNPLQSLMMSSEILVHYSNRIEPLELNKSYKQILKETKNLSELLDNLLQWSRSQSGSIKYEPEKINLGAISENNIKLLNSISEKKKIKLINNISSNIFVYADSNMLTTIIRNLISNSIKFSYSGGEIEISNIKEESDNSKVIICVSDSGMGISPENINKLFRIDVNLSTSGTSNEKGTGLGLILCKEFVEKHDGKIWVESKLEQGSKFYFTIPIYKN